MLFPTAKAKITTSNSWSPGKKGKVTFQDDAQYHNRLTDPQLAKHFLQQIYDDAIFLAEEEIANMTFESEEWIDDYDDGVD